MSISHSVINTILIIRVVSMFLQSTNVGGGLPGASCTPVLKKSGRSTQPSTALQATLETEELLRDADDNDPSGDRSHLFETLKGLSPQTFDREDEAGEDSAGGIFNDEGFGFGSDDGEGSDRTKEQKPRRKRKRTASDVDVTKWIYTPKEGWASKKALDLKALKAACKQRGLAYNNRYSRDVTVALLVDFDTNHSLTQIANQRNAFTSGQSGNVEAEGRWTQNCWARLVHILTTQNIDLSDETSKSLALKCPPGENEGTFTLSDLQLFFLNKDRLSTKEELDAKTKPNDLYWSCFAAFFSEPNVKCIHFDQSNDIIAALDPNNAQKSHAAAKLESKYRELRSQWERCYLINFSASGNNQDGTFLLSVLYY